MTLLPFPVTTIKNKPFCLAFIPIYIFAFTICLLENFILVIDLTRNNVFHHVPPRIRR